jgi:hypothetical protein
MKTKLTTLALMLTASFAFGHGDIELGPNKGRILEFSTNETIHGELTEKDGKLHIAVLDKDMKPMAMDEQTLTATAGTREKPVKLEVTKDDKGFTVAAPGAGEWMIIQFKNDAKAKTITARLEYDTSVCGSCSNPEWLCSCKAEK